MGIKLLIAGSRGFTDYKFLEKSVDSIKVPIESIISGTARGADKLGEAYAKSHNINVIRIPAEWNKYYKRAGYIRNEELAKACDFALIFWDTVSPGTANMIYLLNKYKKEYICYKYKISENNKERSMVIRKCLRKQLK